MQVFDTSSIIHAWDNYPIAQFPGLWAWLGARVGQEAVLMSVVAMDEVGHKTPDCAVWLKSAGLQTLPVTEAILLEALRIKQLLAIDRYGTGVDENDLIIIATVKLRGNELVTNEAAQMTPNRERRNWKIPAVCAMPEVAVHTLDFLRYLKRSEAVFR